MSELFFKIFLGVLLGTLYADEPLLQNITQLTSPEMGFEKSGEAYFSPDGKMISFQAVPTGESDYQIYTLHLDSGELKRISPPSGACTCSFFHPQGKKMIFAMSPYKTPKSIPGVYKWDFTPYMNIYECDLDGSNLVQLTFGEAYHAECAYSPDGTEIVYASNESGSMNLYIMNSDGSRVRMITQDAQGYNGGPFFSPDGKEILFRADYETPNLLQVYKVGSDGNHLVQITSNNAVNWAPFWYPSGKVIAYTTSLHGHHNYQIYLQHLETGKTFRVTYVPTFNGLPTFNADGTKILWTSKRGPDGTSQVFIADFTLPPFEDS